MFVSSSMATRDRSSESARFEVLHAQHRWLLLLLLWVEMSLYTVLSCISLRYYIFLIYIRYRLKERWSARVFKYWYWWIGIFRLLVAMIWCSIISYTSPSLTLYSAIVLNNENSSIHIDAVIDPLSASGQKFSSILRVIQKYVHPSMRIVLNPMVSQLFYLLHVRTWDNKLIACSSSQKLFFLIILLHFCPSYLIL